VSRREGFSRASVICCVERQLTGPVVRTELRRGRWCLALTWPEETIQVADGERLGWRWRWPRRCGGAWSACVTPVVIRGGEKDYVLLALRAGAVGSLLPRMCSELLESHEVSLEPCPVWRRLGRGGCLELGAAPVGGPLHNDVLNLGLEGLQRQLVVQRGVVGDLRVAPQRLDDVGRDGRGGLGREILPFVSKRSALRPTNRGWTPGCELPTLMASSSLNSERVSGTKTGPSSLRTMLRRRHHSGTSKRSTYPGS